MKNILLVFLVSALLFSCNAYRKISQEPPKTSKDSFYLSMRCSSTFPPLPDKVVKGKIDTVTVLRADNTIEDSLSNTIDSLFRANADLYDFLNGVKVNVVNIDSIKQAFKKQIIKDCKPVDHYFYRTDTAIRHSSEDSALIFMLKGKSAKLIIENANLTTKLGIYKGQASTRLWIIILLCLLLGGSLYFNIKKIFKF